MTELVRDARPPRLVVGMLNPLVKVVLRSRAGRLIRPLALLKFSGRRSGRLVSVVVGWHQLDDQRVVVTPASWRFNFAGGTPATVYFRGRRATFVGTLETNPAAVSNCIDAILSGGTTPRALGLSVDRGHTITPDDVRGIGRAVVTFLPA